MPEHQLWMVALVILLGIVVLIYLGYVSGDAFTNSIDGIKEWLINNILHYFSGPRVPTEI